MQTLAQPLTATFNVSSDHKVFYRHWKAVDSAKAVVVIVHGFNSHSGYYQWTADQLVDSGYETYALDLRGRGNSDGERFYIADMNEFVPAV